MKKKSVVIGMMAGLILSCTGFVQAATYTVDDDPGADFSTIQDAITAASAGDTILVQDGDYYENIVLESDIEVLGAGFETTKIHGGHASHVVYANFVTNTVFDGFSVVDSKQDSSSYAGIRINGGNLVVSNNLVTNNLNGIRITGSSSAIIRNNIVTINGIPDNGFLNYGIISLHSTPLITNNIISRTRGTGMYIGWPDSDGTMIVNNTIVDNDSQGIWCYKSSPVIKNNISVLNMTGISASYEGLPQISYNNVYDNIWRNYDSQSGGVAAPGVGDISVDPLLIPPPSNFVRGYYLDEESPCIDAGDPHPIYNDIDGSRNDMGAYGGMNGLPSPGFAGVTSGFVFTTVGKIPVSEITQKIGDHSGLANVSPEAASDLYLYQYTDAPFGGKLWISGLFGSNDDQVRYYRIMVAKWSPFRMHYAPLDDALTKVLYTINPDGTVTPTRETIGPLPNWKDLKGLYKRTDVGYWAHRDLKIVWDTSWFEDGLYSLTFEAYDIHLNKITTLPWNSQQQIILRIDNSPVEATIHEVQYDSGTAIPECGIVALSSTTDNLKFVITARHANGFLRNYQLSVLYGKNNNAGYIVRDQYVGYNDSSPPVWEGVTNDIFDSLPAMKANHLQFWQNPGCAYQFHLRAWARTTDGYTHIRSATFNDHYYLQISYPNYCLGDINDSGEVDGIDLSLMADDYGRTDCH